MINRAGHKALPSRRRSLAGGQALAEGLVYRLFQAHPTLLSDSFQRARDVGVEGQGWFSYIRTLPFDVLMLPSMMSSHDNEFQTFDHGIRWRMLQPSGRARPVWLQPPGSPNYRRVGTGFRALRRAEAEPDLHRDGERSAQGSEGGEPGFDCKSAVFTGSLTHRKPMCSVPVSGGTPRR